MRYFNKYIDKYDIEEGQVDIQQVVAEIFEFLQNEHNFNIAEYEKYKNIKYYAYTVRDLAELEEES